VGTIVNIQKDVNAIAKAKTIAQQKQLVSTKLEIDVENLAFRGCRSLSTWASKRVIESRRAARVAMCTTSSCSRPIVRGSEILRTKIFRALSSCGENGRFFVYCVP